MALKVPASVIDAVVVRVETSWSERQFGVVPVERHPVRLACQIRRSALRIRWDREERDQEEKLKQFLHWIVTATAALATTGAPLAVPEAGTVRGGPATPFALGFELIGI